MDGASPLSLLKTRRLWPLVLAQSCGALNDNLVKNAMIVLAMFKIGAGGAGLSAAAGALFIAPYILASATAGRIADRYSKPRVIRIYKAAEVGLMVAAAAAFLAESVPALLAVLFALGVQAALFGPVKYSMLPEQLAEHEIVAGNGVIEATTFLSIVIGTVAGSALVLLPGGTAIVGAVGVALSLCGLFGAFRIPPAPPADPTLVIGANFLGATWTVVRHAANQRPIWLSLLALSWFWTIGATLLIEFPIVARDTLGSGGSVLTLLLAVFARWVRAPAPSDARACCMAKCRRATCPSPLSGYRCSAGISRVRPKWLAYCRMPGRCWPRPRGGGCWPIWRCWRPAAVCSRCPCTRSFRNPRRRMNGRA